MGDRFVGSRSGFGPLQADVRGHNFDAGFLANPPFLPFERPHEAAPKPVAAAVLGAGQARFDAATSGIIGSFLVFARNCREKSAGRAA